MMAVQAAPALQPAAASAQPLPSWAVLTPAQRATLAPLQADWDTLDSARQRKWLEIARRWPTFSADEQQRLQRRMSRWARMTAEERGRARVHFQQIRRVDLEHRRAAWEAYQALSPEERRELALHAKPSPSARAGTVAARTAAAASAFRPVGPALVQAVPGVSTVTVDRLQGLARKPESGHPNNAAIAARLNPNTLLPKHDARPVENIDALGVAKGP